MHRLIAALITLSVALAAPAARADIFQWEYFNPADPSQGKRQSATLCTDGAGVNAMPGADLSYRNLWMAYLDGADLTNAYGSGAGLTNASLVGANLSGAHITYDGLGDVWEATGLTDADLSQANLTNASFAGATLRGADFTGAEIRGASFNVVCDQFCRVRYGGLTLAQLYSTASYQTYDLAGINLGGNYLAGGNFAHQNLTNSSFVGLAYSDGYGSLYLSAKLIGADFRDANLTNVSLGGATLTGADFTGAELRGSDLSVTDVTLAQLYSTASYQAHDFSGISLQQNSLAGANFAGQKLTNANFYGATLTGADFTNAEVRGASFSRTYDYSTNKWVGGITLAQLYSTASYQAHDLSGVSLEGNNLAGADFAGQNLTNANFYTTLTGTDFTAADVRGAYVGGFASAITTNLIRPDGRVGGLDLDAGELLIVRDYDGNSVYGIYGIDPIPITIDQHLAMGPGGTLRMVFEADAWDSTISFAPGIPVTLGGTLELTFADDVNLASQLGRTFDLFNWTGVSPTGAFAISSPYAWDLSNLYTTGQVTLTAIPEPISAALVLLAAATMFVTRRNRLWAGFLLSLSPLLLVSPAGADIFQWEYINPADPSQGKRQSTTLCPGGAGVDAVPGANLSYSNLTMAYLDGADLMNAIGKRTYLIKASFVGANLSGAHFTGDDLDYDVATNLTDADLSQANLSDATFDGAYLTNADLTGAEIRGASFNEIYAGELNDPFGGLTLAQLYSAASYQAHDLSGISLQLNNLAGANFAGQNLTNAGFSSATLTDADFTGAEIRGASFDRPEIGTAITLAQLYSTASYQAHDLSGISLSQNNLAGANFAGQNLTNAGFSSATLTDADFTGAEIRGASFDRPEIGTAITLAQLYSTASYQAHDLSGISLQWNNLAGANFAGQNVTNADLGYATLTGADFTDAKIRGARFDILHHPGQSLIGTGITLAQLYSTASYASGSDQKHLPAGPTGAGGSRRYAILKDNNHAAKQYFPAIRWSFVVERFSLRLGDTTVPGRHAGVDPTTRNT